MCCCGYAAQCAEKLLSRHDLAARFGDESPCRVRDGKAGGSFCRDAMPQVQMPCFPRSERGLDLKLPAAVTVQLCHPASADDAGASAAAGSVLG